MVLAYDVAASGFCLRFPWTLVQRRNRQLPSRRLCFGKLELREMETDGHLVVVVTCYDTGKGWGVGECRSFPSSCCEIFWNIIRFCWIHLNDRCSGQPPTFRFHRNEWDVHRRSQPKTQGISRLKILPLFNRLFFIRSVSTSLS